MQIYDEKTDSVHSAQRRPTTSMETPSSSFVINLDCRTATSRRRPPRATAGAMYGQTREGALFERRLDVDVRCAQHFTSSGSTCSICCGLIDESIWISLRPIVA